MHFSKLTFTRNLSQRKRWIPYEENDGFPNEKMEDSLMNFILDNLWEHLGKNNPNYFPWGICLSTYCLFRGRAFTLLPLFCNHLQDM
jgi:hypothetical protein